MTYNSPSDSIDSASNEIVLVLV